MLEQFKKDSLNMRKTKDPLSLTLITAMSEAQMVAKNDKNREMIESDLVKQIKKTVVNLKVTSKLLIERGSDASHELAEINVLESYLPKQMTSDELEVVINNILETLSLVDDIDTRSIGDVMRTLKENYDGLYDGKSASGIVRQSINIFSKG